MRMIVKTILIGSTLGIGALAQVSIFEDGKKLESLGFAGLLCVVALACVYAMVSMYRDYQKKEEKSSEKLYALIVSSVESNTKHNKIQEEQVGILVEVKDAIIRCKHNS